MQGRGKDPTVREGLQGSGRRDSPCRERGVRQGYPEQPLVQRVHHLQHVPMHCQVPLQVEVQLQVLDERINNILSCMHRIMMNNCQLDVSTKYFYTN